MKKRVIFGINSIMEVNQTEKTKLLKAKLKSFVHEEFGKYEKFFCMVYGSHAYAQVGNNSDFDFMIVTSNISPGRIKRTTKFAKNLHQKFGISLDNEIRYEDKLIISCELIELACEGHGFKNHLGQWYIPEIVKTKSCLTSFWLRLRFLHGLMVHCNHFLIGDRDYYEYIRMKAAENLLKAICSAQKIESLTPDELVSVFMKHGEYTGDYYLGFRKGLIPETYLKSMSYSLLDGLVAKGHIEKKGDIYNLKKFVEIKNKEDI